MEYARERDDAHMSSNELFDGLAENSVRDITGAGSAPVATGVEIIWQIIPSRQ